MTKTKPITDFVVPAWSDQELSRLSPEDLIQLKANLSELHRQVGVVLLGKRRAANRAAENAAAVEAQRLEVERKKAEGKKG